MAMCKATTTFNDFPFSGVSRALYYVLFTHVALSDKVKEDEIGGTCSMPEGKVRNTYEILMGEVKYVHVFSTTT
jgi:hypothetical protein